jgi:cell division protein ZapA (FtsZ GTPase activity inhibitor)
MAKTTEITVGGKKYVLRGEDEELLNASVRLVDSEYESVKSKHSRESADTISVLAALNIAEKHYVINNQNKVDLNYVVSELNKMTDFINRYIITG